MKLMDIKSINRENNRSQNTAAARSNFALKWEKGVFGVFRWFNYVMIFCMEIFAINVLNEDVGVGLEIFDEDDHYMAIFELSIGI